MPLGAKPLASSESPTAMPPTSKASALLTSRPLETTPPMAEPTVGGKERRGALAARPERRSAAGSTTCAIGTSSASPGSATRAIASISTVASPSPASGTLERHSVSRACAASGESVGGISRPRLSSSLQLAFVVHRIVAANLRGRDRRRLLLDRSRGEGAGRRLVQPGDEVVRAVELDQRAARRPGAQHLQQVGGRHEHEGRNRLGRAWLRLR
eukprot:5560663-Prymnesium_polylepis.1